MAERRLTMNPWLKIWVAPKETIRAIVNFDPAYRFPLLSGIYGLPLLLHAAQTCSLAEGLPLEWIILGALVLAVFAGMLSITIVSALLTWTGRWIGGRGSFKTVRAAVTWSNVPNLVNLFCWIVLMFAFGPFVFYSDFSQMTFVGGALTLVMAIFLIQFIISIWALVILIQSLAEVQGFSGWKALLNVIIPSVMMAGAAWVLSTVLMSFNGAA
jgi:hypothetical protein